jgi:hypothetical protein
VPLLVDKCAAEQWISWLIQGRRWLRCLGLVCIAGWMRHSMPYPTGEAAWWLLCICKAGLEALLMLFDAKGAGKT